MLPRSIAVAVVWLVALAAQARADDADVGACIQSTKGGKDWDRQIAGCSRLLSRGARLNSAARAGAYVSRGLAYLTKTNYDLAIADAGEAIRLKPDLAYGFYVRGEAYRMKSDFDHAIADASAAIRLAPDDPAGLVSRGWSYFAKGDNDHAIEDATAASRIKPDLAEPYAVRGVGYYRKNDWNNAIADLSKALQIKPDYAFALSYRSWAYAEKKDFEGELSDAVAAARLEPDSPMAIYARAVAHNNRKEFDLAIADANEALRLSPKWREAIQFRGGVYAEKGEFDLALSDVDQAIQLLPNNPNALNIRAWTFYKKGDFERAIVDATEAIRLRPGFAAALDTRAQAFASKGDFARAIADETDALKITPDRAEFLAVRADVYRRTGELDRAIADAEAALHIDPKQAKAYAIRAAAYEGKADLPRALADINQSLSLETDAKEIAKTKLEQDRLRAALSAASPAASAPRVSKGRRVALIVAEQNYAGAPLANPRIDAELVKAGLEQAGFVVVVKTDLDLDGFEQALTDFAETAKGADVALFYFAGHGFSVAAGGRQQNLLMSTSANFSAKTMLSLQSGGEPLEHVEETIIGGARATLIFIDACRDVPLLASRSVSARGFAPIDASNFEGAYVVLSTRQGKTAEDGQTGQGSPFARAFARVLPTPGLRIEDAYYRIRETVRAETSGQQIPDVIRSDLPEGGVVLMEAAGR